MAPDFSATRKCCAQHAHIVRPTRQGSRAWHAGTRAAEVGVEAGRAGPRSARPTRLLGSAATPACSFTARISGLRSALAAIEPTWRPSSRLGGHRADLPAIEPACRPSSRFCITETLKVRTQGSVGRSAPSRRALGPRDEHSLRHRLIGAGGRRWRRRQPSCPRTHPKSLRPAGSSVVCGNPRSVTVRAKDSGAPARRAFCRCPLSRPCSLLSSILCDQGTSTL